MFIIILIIFKLRVLKQLINIYQMLKYLPAYNMFVRFLLFCFLSRATEKSKFKIYYSIIERMLICRFLLLHNLFPYIFRSLNLLIINV